MKQSLQTIEIESLEIAGLGRVVRDLRVAHPKFGSGVVVAIFQFPDGKHSVGVDFKLCGYRALAPEYANLRLARPWLRTVLLRLLRKGGASQ